MLSRRAKLPPRAFKAVAALATMAWIQVLWTSIFHVVLLTHVVGQFSSEISYLIFFPWIYRLALELQLS